jgi:RNase H-fold protein (predicted Holliday junction resolvase)
MSAAEEGGQAYPDTRASYVVLGLDPGRDKCGFAALERSKDGTIRVLMQRVIETANLEQEVAEAVATYQPSRLVEGNGTTSKDARTRIERAVPRLAITVIDEYRTTEQAKKEYWKAHPPKGLRRLLPTTMQVPPVPVDDFVAVILVTRYLKKYAPLSEGDC